MMMCARERQESRAQGSMRSRHDRLVQLVEIACFRRSHFRPITARTQASTGHAVNVLTQYVAIINLTYIWPYMLIFCWWFTHFSFITWVRNEKAFAMHKSEGLTWILNANFGIDPASFLWNGWLVIVRPVVPYNWNIMSLHITYMIALKRVKWIRGHCNTILLCNCLIVGPFIKVERPQFTFLYFFPYKVRNKIKKTVSR